MLVDHDWLWENGCTHGGSAGLSVSRGQQRPDICRNLLRHQRVASVSSFLSLPQGGDTSSALKVYSESIDKNMNMAFMQCRFTFLVYIFLLHLRESPQAVLADAHRSLCAVPGWDIAAESSRAQPTSVYFIGCLFHSVKHATQGPCGAMYYPPPLLLFLSLSQCKQCVYRECFLHLPV